MKKDVQQQIKGHDVQQDKGLHEHDLSARECQASLAAVSDALYVIGGKWKLRIIIALGHGSKRFNELQRTVKGISARVLSNELKDLELNGFVHRKVYDAKPVVVEYEPTDYSHTLSDVLGALSEWGRMHRNKIRNRLPVEEKG